MWTGLTPDKKGDAQGPAGSAELRKAGSVKATISKGLPTGKIPYAMRRTNKSRRKPALLAQ
jgi:hypothetical protein